MRETRERDFRLFVACELPPEARDALARVQADLLEQGAGRLRWVRQGIHLTLKFLGAVPPTRRSASPTPAESNRRAVHAEPALRPARQLRRAHAIARAMGGPGGRRGRARRAGRDGGESAGAAGLPAGGAVVPHLTLASARADEYGNSRS